MVYEDPKCEEFQSLTLPEAKIIWGRNSENWRTEADFFMGYGQWLQDWFVYNNFFRGKKHGLYLDIGTYEPYELSNTAVMEQCFGWSGFCVEPNPRMHQGILSYRQCGLLPHCLAGNKVTHQQSQLERKVEKLNFLQSFV